MPSWDPSISLGNVLTLAAFVASLLTLHVNNVKRLEKLNTKLDIMFRWWERHIVNKVDDK